jgi:hypothetical protein
MFRSPQTLTASFLASRPFHLLGATADNEPMKNKITLHVATKRIPRFLLGLAVFASVNLVGSPHLAAEEPPPPGPPDQMVIVIPPTEVAEDIVNQFVPRPEIDPVALIVFPDRGWVRARSKDGLFSIADILPGETVSVQVQFPPTSIGQTITVQVFDSGSATAARPEETLGADRLVPFVFTAGDQPGLYRVVIKVGEIASTLQFWVGNPDDPSDTPPLLLPQPGPVPTWR